MRLTVSAIVLVIISGWFTDAKAFSDVPTDHIAAEAIADLTERGVVSGYGDGTYRLAELVNRAEATKMLVHALQPDFALSHAQYPVPYTDVAAGAWYAQPVGFALRQGAIDGPPEAEAFHGSRPVTLAEFLKMLFLLDGQSMDRYSQEEKPVAEDVDDFYIWFYPYVAHGVVTTMITPYLDAGLHPGKPLTRADTALYLHRYLLYKEGQHLERAKALFASHVEAFTAEHSQLLDSDLSDQLSFRLILLALGMRDAEPETAEYQAFQKIAWATGKIFQENLEAARTLLAEAAALSPQTYEQYFAELGATALLEPK